MTIGGGAGCVLDGKRNLGVDINDHVELEASQLLREFTEPFVRCTGEPPFNREIPSTLLAELAQTLS